MSFFWLMPVNVFWSHEYFLSIDKNILYVCIFRFSNFSLPFFKFIKIKLFNVRFATPVIKKFLVYIHLTRILVLGSTFRNRVTFHRCERNKISRPTFIVGTARLRRPPGMNPLSSCTGQNRSWPSWSVQRRRRGLTQSDSSSFCCSSLRQYQLPLFLI